MRYEMGLQINSLAPIRLPLVVHRVLVAQQARSRRVALAAEGTNVLERVLRVRGRTRLVRRVDELALTRAAAFDFQIKNELAFVVVVFAHLVYNLTDKRDRKLKYIPTF